MADSLSPVKDMATLKKKLESDMILNSGFLWGVFHSGEPYEVHATPDMGAAIAIQKKDGYMIFTGDWAGIGIPKDLLPEKGAFVSASPPSAIEALKEHYRLEGEWPCWLFLAPDGYGEGEWDDLGPLADSDVSFIASFWELGGEDREEHIRDSVKRFESACLRVGGKPVSWCGLHFEMPGVGNLGFAHTIDEHRRKGCQALVTKALVNSLHRKGSRATSDVIKDNAASISLCKSLGFRVVGEQTWADFKKRD